MNYLFSLKGRFGRLQWWSIQLIVGVLLVGSAYALGSSLSSLSEDAARRLAREQGVTFLLSFLVLFVFCCWINVAATVKRYHDRDKSGFWFLIVFIPFIGGIWQLVECGFLSGTGGSNSYGQRRALDVSFLDGSELRDESPRQSRAMKAERNVEPPQASAPAVVRRSAGLTRPKPASFGRRGL
ncbi:DUF805 domain-containing protein [Mesorhizobium sp. CN2-181]|uniref:DUF805 domain-containing protein n=1 Tax=Mesorhizobium yinganensis TaxID=3157707 RepID=UPI0032B835F6